MQLERPAAHLVASSGDYVFKSESCLLAFGGPVGGFIKCNLLIIASFTKLGNREQNKEKKRRETERKEKEKKKKRKAEKQKRKGKRKRNKPRVGKREIEKKSYRK